MREPGGPGARAAGAGAKCRVFFLSALIRGSFPLPHRLR